MPLPEPTAALVTELQRLAAELQVDAQWREDALTIARAAIRLEELGRALEELFLTLRQASTESRED